MLAERARTLGYYQVVGSRDARGKTATWWSDASAFNP